MTPTTRARVYFGAQALAGAVWWALVAMSEDVRDLTLGGWDPALVAGPDLVLFVGASALAAALGSRIAGVIVAAWSVLVTLALTATALVDQVGGWGVVTMTVASACSLVAATTLWFGHVPTGWFFIGPFRFTEARDRTSSGHLARSLVQLVVFWATFFVLVPGVLTALERRLDIAWPALQHEAIGAVGLAVFLGGCAVGLWSCISMALRGRGTPLPAETARELVVDGPYTYVRNPMAVAGAAQVIGVGLWLGSWTVLVVGVVGAVTWNVVIRPVEEADLAARFGGPYDEYRSRVRCWIPTLRGTSSPRA